MISNPKNGWCDFCIEDFTGHPSDATNVPIDLLQAFVDYDNYGKGITWINEETSSFTVVLSQDGFFIISISQANEVKLYQFHKSIDFYKKELIKDIKSDFNNWVNFDFDLRYLEGQNSTNAKNTNRYRLRNKLEELKK